MMLSERRKPGAPLKPFFGLSADFVRRGVPNSFSSLKSSL